MKNQIHVDALRAGLVGPCDQLTEAYTERLQNLCSIVAARTVRREISERLSYRLGFYDGKKCDPFYDRVTKKVSALILLRPPEDSREGILLDALSALVHEHWRAVIASKLPSGNS